jgi:hypothetical protein
MTDRETEAMASIFIRWCCGFAALAALMLLGSSASAQSCGSGEGLPCLSSADCVQADPARPEEPKASVCVGANAATGTQGTCEFPCEAGTGVPQAKACTLGEACTSTISDAKTRYYCKPGTFSIDLNLLDMCVNYFIEGGAEALGLGGAQGECSLERKFALLLDRNQDRVFTIDDVDLCIKTFLDTVPCDRTRKTCANGDQFCETDAACGEGLFCNRSLWRCERQCGTIPNRAGNKEYALERPCSKAFTECNASRGRCELNPLYTQTCSNKTPCPTGATCFQGKCSQACMLDRDCPSGAYCALGSCQAKCFRNLDCPDTNWMCDERNTCVPKPRPGAEGGARDPKQFSVLFAQQEVALDVRNDRYEVPLVILDRQTNSEIAGQARQAMRFGYRLEVKYGLKEEARCQKAPTPADCVIDPDREFVTLESPFGTLSADPEPTVALRLNSGAVAKLDPGRYSATVTAIFTNGGTSSTRVTFEKPTPSGRYGGRVELYLGHPNNHLGGSNVALQLLLTKEIRVWNQLLKDENLATQTPEFQDVTEGQAVYGLIDASQGVLFDNPGATSVEGLKVPVKGIYSERLKRLRLIGVIDVSGARCQSEPGLTLESDCSAQSRLKVRNVFQRPMRRIVEFMGPYDPVNRSFSGVYRETISGLTPSVATIEGGFDLRQTAQDESEPTLGTEPVRNVKLAASTTAVTFTPGQAQLSATITAHCTGELAAVATSLSTEAGFKAWLAGYDTPRESCWDKNGDGLCTRSSTGSEDTNGDQLCNERDCAEALPYLRSLVSFKAEFTRALASLDAGDAQRKGAITLADHFAGSLGLEGEPGCGTQYGCIPVRTLQCGLALHRRALRNGWVDRADLWTPECWDKNFNGQCDTAAEDQDRDGKCDFLDCPAAPTHLHTLFCETRAGDPQDSGCKNIRASEDPALVVLLEHNRFWRELARAYTFRAGSEASDAFFALYKAPSQAKPLEAAWSLDFKSRKLSAALDRYDELRGLAFSSASAETLFSWPMAAFQQQGAPWLKLLHNTARDRFAVLAQIQDLERRQLQNPIPNFYVLAKHAAHLEYLHHVYLALLERTWEGSSFAYGGSASEVFSQAELLLAKASAGRNPFGLPEDRVFFDGSESESRMDTFENTPTWERYYLNLKVGRPDRNQKALLDRLEELVSAGVTAMRAAMAGETELAQSFTLVEDETEAQLTSLCGSELDLAVECLKGIPDETPPLASLQCNGEECAHAVQVFKLNSKDAVCNAEASAYTIEGPLGRRPCVRGQMGRLLQERLSLELTRKQILDRQSLLLRQLNREKTNLEAVQKENAEFVAYLRSTLEAMGRLDEGIRAANHGYEAAATIIDIADCVAGTATNCPGKTTAQKAKAVALGLRNKLISEAVLEKVALDVDKQLTATEFTNTKELREARARFDSLVADAQNLVPEYERTLRQIQNIDLEIADTLYEAEALVKRQGAKVEVLLKALDGEHSATVLHRNSAAQAVDALFEQALLDAYKMTQAFVYRYNIKSLETELLQDLYRVGTVPELRAYVDKVWSKSENMCGLLQQGDCATWKNGQLLSLSLQKLLFPGLRSKTDAETGSLVTAGEQFHNIITSSAYRRKRLSGNTLQTFIEVPFAIWANARGPRVTDASGPSREWMLPPSQCNHVITATRGTGGTVGVGISAEQLAGRHIDYLLYRGGTDYMRSCTEPNPGTDTGMKIETFLVGWPKGDPNGLINSPPGFSSRVAGTACDGREQLNDLKNGRTGAAAACFASYFGLDRSLAAPDWVFVIPEVGPGERQAWVNDITINDVVLAIRYNSLNAR